MTDQQTGLDSMEGRHLNENLNLIREDIREMRQELREGLERRPTHSDLNALKLLVDKQIELITQRSEQDKIAHVQSMDNMRAVHTQAMENLNKDHARLKAVLDKIKEDSETTQKEKDRLQKQMVVGFLTTLGGLGATNLWGFFG